MVDSTFLKIELLRQRKTLKEIALEAQVDLFRAYRIANGIVRPKPGELEALAEALGVPLEKLSPSRPAGSPSR